MTAPTETNAGTGQPAGLGGPEDPTGPAGPADEPHLPGIATLDRIAGAADAYFEHPLQGPGRLLDRIGERAAAAAHDHHVKHAPVNRLSPMAKAFTVCGVLVAGLTGWAVVQDGGGQNAWMTDPGAAAVVTGGTASASSSEGAADAAADASAASSSAAASTPANGTSSAPGTSSTAGTAAAAGAAAATGTAVAAPGATAVPLVIQTGAMDGRSGWPRFVPADVTVKAGIPVTLTITNHDDGSAPLTPALSTYDNVQGGTETVDGKAVTSVPNADVAHTWTVPALGLNVVVPVAPTGGTNTVTFTFTPAKTGSFTWQCYAPCGTGSDGTAGPMSTNGWMRGTLTVN